MRIVLHRRPSGNTPVNPNSADRYPAVRFPLADWIDDHADCRYNLGNSGMKGTIVHPRPTLREIRSASSGQLVDALAERLGVDASRVYLTSGATEANAWVTQFVAQDAPRRPLRARVRFPEYPPLVEGARWAGFHVGESSGAATLALVSLPRNPEGVLWSDDELFEWRQGARATLIDETFREFTEVRSHAGAAAPTVWVTGTFTKFYAADDVRVGYVVAPPEATASFARFHGVVTDQLAPHSIAAALRILREGEPLRARVRRVFERNRQLLARTLPIDRPVSAPVYFDRVPDGTRLTQRCLRASVLVCPGALFGTPAGVRITLTRHTFPKDFAQYFAVRERVLAAARR
jgi:histidinol-phosphate/aromatic aminotransferase/cobyric acid decarboxylase-like protein